MLRMEGVFAPGAAGQPVLRGADLVVEAGEVRVIFGESCAGKSTLLELLGGLEHPERGRVSAGDRDLARLRASSLRRLRRRLPLVSESPLFVEEASAFDNVALPLWIDAVPAAELRRRAAAALAEVGLESVVDVAAGRLARSQRRCLALARALVARPLALLLDEPGCDLDETGREDLCNTIDRLAAGGVACVITSGDQFMLELAELWGWGVSELRDGVLTPFHQVSAGRRPRAPGAADGDRAAAAEMGRLLAFPSAARADGGAR